MSLPNEPVRIGEWLVDPRDDSLTRGTERIKLEPRTMRLLMTLAQAPGEVVSQDQLLETVWAGVVVGPASVYQSVSQLRKVMGDTEDPPRYIATVARRGYRLVAAVAPVARRAAAAVETTSDAGPGKPAPAPRRRSRWPVAALVVILAVAGVLWQFWWKDASASSPPTVVVLPFLDLTEAKDQQTFCDGLTEETSNWLAQVPTLRVVARSSAFAYRDRKTDVRTIGRELKTSHLLEGSLRRSGDRMRINVQLIDTNTGFNLWSDAYDVEVGDVLSVQEDVARKVAGNLELRISSETDSRFDSRRSKVGPAQELYLNARANALKFDSNSNELAITLYRQALRADPAFALAKIYLAQAISNRRYFNSQPIETLLPEILPLLAEAEKTAPQLADLYAVRGAVYVNLRRRELAERDLKRALELNPNSTEAAGALGRYYLGQGQPRESLSYYTITWALDPRDFGWQGYRCMALSDMAQFDEADKACAQARMLGSASPWVYSVSSNLEAARGRMDEALRYSAASIERDNNVVAVYAERARWLRELGLIPEAGAVFRDAVAANPEAARRNGPLIMSGAAAALNAGGARGLQSFVREFDLAESDDPVLLFELANAWVTVGDYARARDFVERATASEKFTSDDLESPWLARTGRSFLLVSAMVLRKNGEVAAAEQRLARLETLLARMEDSGVRTAGLYELKAQLGAMQGRGDNAVAALRRAVDLGWSAAWLAEHEPYFDSVRSRDDFRSLLATVRARNAGTAAKLRQRTVPPASKGV